MKAAGKLRVLVVGGGGREHALTWKIAQSPLVERVFCAPGNGGTAGEPKAENITIATGDFERLCEFALDNEVGLVVIGPDNPLADGIVDVMEEKGLTVFGPRKASARLESSKAHAKEVMTELGIPTARFATFTDETKALEFARSNSWARIVKEDGLALGKGVIVCDSLDDVQAALARFFSKKALPSKNVVVVEDRLWGEELSLFLVSDGKRVVTLAACQDHKRRLDGDRGPNTGGMGAYSPVPLYESCRDEIEKQVLAPIARALAAGKLDYKGVLFAGLMICDGQPYVLEFNARFGDPETQAIMPRLKSDIVPLLLASAEGRLEEVQLTWDERFSLCVVACARDYPDNSSSGEAITIKELPADTHIFHAGTSLVEGILKTNGGRVLAVTALDSEPERARDKAYEALKAISYKDMDYRKDIGWRVFTTCHSR